MAKRQEVLLTKDVLKLGNMGDVVRVAAGYARNYLYPFELGVPVGTAAKRQIEVLREKAVAAEGERENHANALKKTLEGMSVQIAARVAHDDVLFGSIGTRDIVSALAKSGVAVDGKQVHLNDKLKKLGKHQVEVRLHKNVGVKITVEIVNSDPNAPALQEALAPDAAPAESAAATIAAPAAAKPTVTKPTESKVKNLGPARKNAAAAPAPAKGATIEPTAPKGKKG